MTVSFVSGDRRRFRCAARILVLAPGRPAAPFWLLLFHLAEPCRRPATAAAASTWQPLQAENGFFDLFAFLAQVGQHLVYVHGASIYVTGPVRRSGGGTNRRKY